MGTAIQPQPQIRADYEATAAGHKSQPWYIAYMAALFETDKKRIGERINHARHLILNRERELFAGQRDPAEQRSLISALHALEALRSCLGL